MKKIQDFVRGAMMFFFLIITGYLSVAGFFLNADIPLDGVSEQTVFHKNLWPVTIFFTGFVIYAVYKFRERITATDTGKLIKMLLAYDFCLCVLWIALCNTKEGADQAQVLYAAKAFVQGNYEKLTYNQYMGLCPHQLPLALLYEPFYILFGDVTPFLWQFINAVLICAIQYLLYFIVKSCCSRKGLVNLYLLLQFTNLPIILYVSFIYGTIIGLFWALAAVCFLLVSLADCKWTQLLLSAFCIACSCLLRTNNIIVLIAMMIVAVMSAARGRKKLLLLIPLSFLFLYGGRLLVYKFYEVRSGMEISDGIPPAMYIAMGLSNNTERAAGWYNGYTWDVYLELNCDRAAVRSFAAVRISEALKRFCSSAGYTGCFFNEKILSTWLNPDFQGLWNNEHHGHYVARAPVIYNLFTGELHVLSGFLLGNFQFLIYFGAFLSMFGLRKKMNWEQLSLAIVFIGGFFFHLFWETKAQYVVVYYILLFPYAAAGFWRLGEMLDKHFTKSA